MGTIPRADLKAQILIQKARVRSLKMHVAQGIFKDVPAEQLKEPLRLLKIEMKALRKLRGRG
jgi:hypothetical protein